MLNLSFKCHETLNQSSEIDLNQEYGQQALPLDPRLGIAQLHWLNLQMGIKFIRLRANFSQHNSARLPIGILEINSPSEQFNIFIPHIGQVIVQDTKPEIEYMIQPDIHLFATTKKIKSEISLDCNSDVEVSCFFIPKTTLELFFGENLAHQLHLLLGIGPAQSAIKKIPKTLCRVFNKTSMQSDKDLLKSIIQTQLLSYLTNLIVAFSSNTTHATRTVTKELLFKICEKLLNVEGPLPSLEEACKSHDVSAYSLDKAFIKEFGKSYYKFFFSHRMYWAQDIIRSTSTPLKEISQQLGYSHVNHFNHAFRIFFGYPPGSLRELD